MNTVEPYIDNSSTTDHDFTGEWLTVLNKQIADALEKEDEP